MNARDELLKRFPTLVQAKLGEALRPDHEPYEVVKRNYTLPFDLYPFQIEGVNDLAWRPRAGFYWEMGLGKSIAATISALYKMLNGVDLAIVLVPPILIAGWVKYINQIPETKAVAYRGSPKERERIRFDAPFMVMSYQIFKRDYERICSETAGKRVMLIADEASVIKDVGTDNHRKVFEFSAGHDLCLLTGTPLSKPEDAYAYCRMIAPGTYRSMGHFNSLHVGEVDFFGKVISYRNLDMLADNMKINASRVLKQDVLKDLPDITYTPLYYEMDADHERLYNKLADEQLLKLDNGSKIDATSTQALYHALGQIITNYGHFSGDDRNISASIEMLEEVLDELAGRKLLVFTNYRMTNELLGVRLKKYNGRVIYGGTSEKATQEALRAFVNDPSCRALALQVRSGGFGLDGLQHVANDVLFLEIPPVPAWFHQAVARLHRVGQKNNVNVRVAVAQRTCNVRQFKQLMDKDALVNRVVRNVKDLREVIRGG